MEVTHESGCQRMISAWVSALVIAPICILAGCFLAGTNEQNSACTGRAIDAGKSVVREVTGNDPSEQDGQLVKFTNLLSPESANIVWSSKRPDDYMGTNFRLLPNFTSPGLKVSTEVRQCQEIKTSHTQKDSVGGGKTTYTTYSYNLVWSTSSIDSSYFNTCGMCTANSFWQNCNPPRSFQQFCQSQQCGGQYGQNQQYGSQYGQDQQYGSQYVAPALNSWPPGLPTTGVVYADEAKVGAFWIPHEYVEKIELRAALADPRMIIDPRAPPHFALGGAPWCGKNEFCSGNADFPGATKISFYAMDWSHSEFSVLGENDRGNIRKWKAPDSWLCSGFVVGDIFLGKMTVDQFFAMLHQNNQIMTWFLRCVAFILAWVGFGLCAKPLEVAADCIPCIGPCLGDSIQAIACCAACMPGLGIITFVAGLVWLVMRPLLGIPLLLVSCGVSVYIVHYLLTRQAKARERKVAALQEPLKFSAV